MSYLGLLFPADIIQYISLPFCQACDASLNIESLCIFSLSLGQREDVPLLVQHLLH